MWGLSSTTMAFPATRLRLAVLATIRSPMRTGMGSSISLTWAWSLETLTFSPSRTWLEDQYVSVRDVGAFCNCLHRAPDFSRALYSEIGFYPYSRRDEDCNFF